MVRVENNMRLTIITFIILSFFILTGCYNYTTGESNICKVHKVKMTKTAVPILYGLFAYEDCSHLYPNGGSYVLGGCVVKGTKSCIVYRCNDCRNQWVKAGCWDNKYRKNE